MKELRFSNRSGAVLLFALLLLVVGGTILGGVAQLAVTQSVAGQAEWDSAARRIRLENSRALARQYILSQMWRGFGQLPTATLAASATGGLGGFAITGVDPGFWLSLTQQGNDRINPFNLFERGGFQSAWATGSLTTGSGDISWGFQVRTRSPIIAGFVFVNHLLAENDVAAAPRIDMRQTDYAEGFVDLPRMPVSSVSGTGGSDTTGFLGYLSAPRGEARFGDFLAAVAAIDPVVVPDGSSAYVELDLSTYNYFNPDGALFYEVPSSVDQPLQGNWNVPVTKLVLKGGSQSAGPPVQVLVPEFNTTLTTIELSGDNTRPVYVFQKGVGNNLSVTTAGASTSFRIAMTLYSPTTLSPVGSLTIVGGMRTDRPLGNAGSVTFVAEGSPGWAYDAVADRMMWLEDQRVR